MSSSSSNVKSGHISKELVILIWYKDMKVWTILTNEGVLSVCHWIGAGVLSTGGAIIRSYFQLISESHKLPPSFHPITGLNSDNHPITGRDNFSLHTCRHQNNGQPSSHSSNRQSLKINIRSCDKRKYLMSNTLHLPRTVSKERKSELEMRGGA